MVRNKLYEGLFNSHGKNISILAEKFIGTLKSETYKHMISI